MVKRFLNIFKASKPEPKQLWGGFNSWLQSNRGYGDTVAALKGWSFACIEKRANAVAALEWQVMQNDKEQGEKHWLFALLKNPSSRLTRYELFEQLSKSLDVYGNAYLYTPIGAGNRPISLEFIPPASVQIIIKDGAVSIYRISVGGSFLELTAQEVCHLRTLQTTNKVESQYLGEPLINAAIDAIHADAALVSYIKNYFQNDALPPLVFTNSGEIEAEQGNRFRALWNDKFPNHQIAGFLENGMDIKPVTAGGVGANSLNVTQLDADNLTRIAAVFGLSKGKITGDNQNKATADVNDYSFRVDTIEPLAQRLEQSLTKHFRQFDKTVSITHERYIFKDEATEQSRRSFELNNGLKTINEIRAELGLQSVTNGNELFIQNGLMKLSDAIQGTPIATPEATVKKKVVRKSWTEAEIKTHWDKWNNFSKGYEEDLKAALAGEMANLETEVLTNLETAIASNSTLFDASKFAAAFEKSCGKVLSKQIEAAAKEAVKEVANNWDGVTSDLDRQIKSALEESAAKASQGVGTIELDLKDTVKANKGKPIEELKIIIRAKFQNNYRTARVATIAGTTSNYATNAAQAIVYKEAKVTRIWTSQRDKDVRPAHKVADGQKSDENGMFHVGGESLPFPSGGQIGANNVRCRCYQRPRA